MRKAEIGFAVTRAITTNQKLVVYVSTDLCSELQENVTACKESSRARTLVKVHLSKLNHSNVTESLDEMLKTSLKLI